MPITPTNQSKNSVSPQNTTRNGFFLLMENGFYLLQETGYKIILDLPSYGVSGTNQSKNSVSPTGQSKS